MGRLTAWTVLTLVLLAFAATVQDVRADVPSENECRPYIEKALHELKGDAVDAAEDGIEILSEEDNIASKENGADNESDNEAATETADSNAAVQSTEDGPDDDADDASADANASTGDDNDDEDDDDHNDDNGEPSEEASEVADDEQSEQQSREKRSAEDEDEDTADDAAADDEDDDNDSKTENDTADDSGEVTDEAKSAEEEEEASAAAGGDSAEPEAVGGDSKEEASAAEDSKEEEEEEAVTEADDSKEEVADEAEGSKEDTADSNDADADGTASTEGDEADSKEEEEEAKSVESDDAKSGEEAATDDAESGEAADNDDAESGEVTAEASAEEEATASAEVDDAAASREKRDVSGEDTAEGEEADDDKDAETDDSKQDEAEDSKEDDVAADESKEEASEVTKPVESFPEDDLLIEYTVPTNLRDHSHVTELLRLDEEFDEKEAAINKVADFVLKDLKKIYENAIKPLETLYKYRDLSNRHFGDPEIFSKPLVLFMGPWSGGKSTILNYLTDNEHTADSLRTGAEPSPAYFNILMHGDKPEVLDGTQLAADWTFSGLQKFGQGLEERLRGQKLPHKLLEKVNIVEIPGILEVRKQVSRLFPFNDACQWFIDRADIIFLVYDPSKLDVGPETEAILDQLKGREYQTRILLNKADQVKPEELLRVQGALIWNISPLMSSAQPPVMYTTSLWSHPYEDGAPVRLLQAQERALLRDLRGAIDKRIDNKIASARRFAVRVRNHAKMVDCYLTTYYNHKTLFGNKNLIANNIIENPQNYHIYEGLSTLTNISRYDLPDPEVYRDFFRLNKLYDFKKLSETCTYFRGCPINKLDIAIAYDLPELVGKYKKAAEAALVSIEKKADGGKS